MTRKLRKKVFFAAGHTTVFMGTGRPEFHPKKPMPTFEKLLSEDERWNVINYVRTLKEKAGK